MDKVDHVISCCPDDRCACGGQLILNSNYRRHQQYEFPIIRPVVTEYQIYSGSCIQCNQTQAGSLPDGVSLISQNPDKILVTITKKQTEGTTNNGN